jgi:hypothetical protein
MRKFAVASVLFLHPLIGPKAYSAEPPAAPPITLPADAPNLAVLYETLARQIRRGDVILYIVPFSSSGNELRSGGKWWMTCTTMPKVNAEGQRQAKAIHQSLALFSAPLGLVWSSEVCMSMTSASYVAGPLAARIHSTPDLNPVELQRQDGAWDGVISERIRSKFGATIAGKNNILSGHKVPLELAPHPVLASLETGDSALFTLGADGTLDLLARLTWSQWREMHDYILRQALRHQRVNTKKK